MARRRALVRKLAAVETLGSTSVICTDKTGTLTVGQMTVRALFVAEQTYTVTGEGYGLEGVVQRNGATVVASPQLLELATCFVACNNAQLVTLEGRWATIGDPTEGALLVAGAKAGADRDRIERLMPKQGEYPFDSERKRSSVIRTNPNGTLRAFTNGAPGVLLERCTSIFTEAGARPLTEQDRANILGQTSAMAKKALRVLASASRDLGAMPMADLTADLVERELTFVGLAGMYDPPRFEAKAALAKCHAAGIRVVMMTGDHPETAKAIAHEIGITATDEAPVTGVELEQMSDEVLRSRVPTVAVYARVTAEHKLRIVRALKATGAVVAMTGDGVNDAPAIKGADIGIAMGTNGTEVTKQAADMIITDDNFATIVVAVEEGRGIYDNIRKTLQYLLAGNTGELLLMTTCAVGGLAAPLLPIHLLWVNFVTDGFPAFCLATDPIDTEVMTRPPRPRLEKMTDRDFLRTVALTGVLTAGVAFGVYWFCLQTHTPEFARTAAFAVLVFAELLRSFGGRSATQPLWRVSLRTNIKLVVVVAVTIGLQMLSHHNAMLGRFFKTSPMSWRDGLMLLGLGAIPLVVLELVKAIQSTRPSSGVHP
jgi:Ca2+-transporting ATPase